MIYAITFLDPDLRAHAPLDVWPDRYEIGSVVFIAAPPNQTEVIAQTLGMDESSGTHGFVVPVLQMAGLMPQSLWEWSRKSEEYQSGGRQAISV